MKELTEEKFKEWLRKNRNVYMGLYSVRRLYMFLGGKRFRLINYDNKVDDIPKHQLEWLRKVWMPFYREVVSKKLEEFNIRSVLIGNRGMPLYFTLKPDSSHTLKSGVSSETI